jgi:hypothetical protein
MVRAFALLTLPTALLAQTRHLEEKVTWDNKPVAIASLDARLRDAAIQYRVHAPVPRIAMFDISYPVDSAEAARLNGYGLMIVTTATQDSAELPVARLYLRSTNGDLEAPLLAVVRSTIDASDTTVRTVFGRHRADALYLVPLVAVSRGEVSIMVDFAIRRQGFRLGVLHGQNLPQTLDGYAWPKQAEQPARENLLPMLRREYPGAAEFFFP